MSGHKPIGQSLLCFRSIVTKKLTGVDGLYSNGDRMDLRTSIATGMLTKTDLDS